MHVARSLRAGGTLDTRLATLKPKILDWSLKVIQFFRSDEGTKLIAAGFEMAGYGKCFDPEFQQEACREKERLFKAPEPRQKGQRRKKPTKPPTKPAPKPSAKSAPKAGAKSAPTEKLQGPLDKLFAAPAPIET